jgi:hypothetical protein
LNTAQHKAAEVLYKSANAGGAEAGGASAGGAEPRAGAAGQAGSSGDVIDAEVVEEEKK